MLGAFWSELRYRLRTMLCHNVVERELDDELHSTSNARRRSTWDSMTPPAPSRNG